MINNSSACMVHRSSTSSVGRTLRYGARSIQPKFPEISVQNSMDRFGPTGKVSKNGCTFWGAHRVGFNPADPTSTQGLKSAEKKVLLLPWKQLDINVARMITWRQLHLQQGTVSKINAAAECSMIRLKGFHKRSIAPRKDASKVRNIFCITNGNN